jgi:hypothetical protein
MAVCSSPISRPAYSALTTLTASSLNTNLDTVYTRANELPGDCITSESITTTQIDDGTITSSDVTASFYATISPEQFHNVLQASGIFTTDMSDVLPYILGNGTQPLTTTLAITGSTFNTIYIDDADYPAVSGKTRKLRISAQLYTNDTAPGMTFTVGLYPLTRPASSGGDGFVIFTVGTVTASSTAVFTTPTADLASNVSSSEFAFPADGHYAIGVSLTGGTGLIVAAAEALLTTKLQVVYVD